MDPQYSQPGPPPQQPPQQPMYAAPPPPPPPRPSGGGLNSYIGVNVDASPGERTAIMLLRLIAWISLIFIVIAICSDFFRRILDVGQGDVFRNLLNLVSGTLLGFAGAAVGAATLLALASIVESLIIIRRKP